MKTLRRFGLVFLASLLLLLLTLGVLLQAAEGEWAHRVRLGPLQYRLALAPVLKVLMQPQIIHVLHGREMASPWGRLYWQEEARGRLQLQCRPCRVQIPALSEQALDFSVITLSLQRDDEVLIGELRLSSRVGLHFRAPFDAQGMQLHAQLPATAIVDIYTLFGPSIPELARARIQGTLAMDIGVKLPAATYSIQPSLQNFRVSGLGTELLRSRLPQVQCPGAPLAAFASAGRWLPRAVIAAEDQRFYQHPGYDLRELLASLQRNHLRTSIARGGSTLDQQLAKLLFTGSERTHVRKLRELLYAVEMEETLGKARILKIYLAVAPWGKNICGAENAARVYYGKPAAQLNRAEAAWLAAMLHTPDREFRRWKNSGHPDVKRGSWVVSAMGGGKQAQQAAVLMLASLAPPPAF
ncbi:MAG: transglycosylase domain-containing protein [Moraxellaceae bacterium]